MEGTQFSRRLWISFSIIFGAIVLASVALYYVSGNLSASADKIVANRTLINQETTGVATLAQLKQDAATAATYQSAMEQLLPTQDGLINFSGWLQKIGNGDQVAVNTTFNPNAISPNPPGSVSVAQTMGFSIQAQGSVSALAAFLKDIQSKPGFFVHINSFDMVSNSGSETLSAQGIVFFRSE